MSLTFLFHPFVLMGLKIIELLSLLIIIQTTLILVSLSVFNVIISRLSFECPLTFLFHPLTWFRLVLYQDLNLISVCMASKS